MFCKLSLASALAMCVASAVSADTEFQLFAYGKVAKAGAQLFYGDGQAYIGGTPSFVKQSVNITLSMVDEEFIAKADTTAVDTLDWSPEPTMYVDLTEGAANPIGFTKDNETLPINATTVGFGLYGGWAFHKKEDDAIEMKFVATPTNETDIYLVKWNTASTRSSDDIAISLRTQAPVALDNK